MPEKLRTIITFILAGILFLIVLNLTFLVIDFSLGILPEAEEVAGTLWDWENPPQGSQTSLQPCTCKGGIL